MFFCLFGAPEVSQRSSASFRNPLNEKYETSARACLSVCVACRRLVSFVYLRFSGCPRVHPLHPRFLFSLAVLTRVGNVCTSAFKLEPRAICFLVPSVKHLLLCVTTTWPVDRYSLETAGGVGRCFLFLPAVDARAALLDGVGPFPSRSRRKLLISRVLLAERFLFRMYKLLSSRSQVKVRKRSMAGKTEIRRLYVRGDTIELVNPEKRMFRSQSKIFPLSELTAVSRLTVELGWFQVQLGWFGFGCAPPGD